MTDDTSTTLVRLGVATLHEALGRRNVIQGIQLLVGEPFAGTAVTVALPAGDNLGVHLAIESAPPASVVCISSTGQGRYGVLGELLHEAARTRRVAGLVIDDSIRDLDHLDAPPSVAARGTSPRGTIKHRVRQSVGAPVSIGHTLIRAGDWIVCDHDGICVLDLGEINTVMRAAQKRVKKENRARLQIQDGVPTRVLFALPDCPPASLGD